MPRPPSGAGEKTRASVWMNERPWRSRPRSRTTVGRKGPAPWSTVETRKPGANSSVTDRPPTSGRRSRTSGRWPAFARYAAAVSPLGPAPTTITSLAAIASGRRAAAPVLQDLLRGVLAVGAHDPAARVRRGAAHVEAADGRAVLRPPGSGAEEEELLERQLALEDVALGQAELALDVERREDLPVLDDALDVRRVLRDRVDDRVAERVAFLVPVALQVVGRVLDEARHDVLARRRERRIGERRDDHVDVRAAREPSVLGVVVRTLHVLDGRRDRDRAAQVGSRTGHALEVGERVEREVDLPRGAAELVALDVLDEVAGELLLADHAEKRQARVDARGDGLRRDLLAALEDDAGGAAVRQLDLRDRRLRPDLDPRLDRRRGDRVGDRAGSAAGEAPRAEGAVDLAHVVVEQDVRRAGRAHAEEGPDDAGRGHRRLQDVRLEPLVEEVHGRHRHQLDLVVAVVVRQPAESLAHEEEVLQALPVQLGRVGRRHSEDRLDEASHVGHRLAVLVVRLGVDLRVARDLAVSPAVVVDAPEIVAVGHRRERAVERQDLEAVPRQVEVADDLGPQKRDDVGADREAEAGEDLLGHRGAAEHMAPLEHEDLLARAREIGGVNEPVVPAADHDDVVARAHSAARSCIELTLGFGKRPCRERASILIIPRSDKVLIDPGSVSKRTDCEVRRLPIGTAVHERTFPLCESLNFREWSGYYAVSAYEAHHEHEYNAIRQAAALIDISPLFKYLVTGRDAVRLVDRVITRDARKLAVGQVYRSEER